MRKLGKLVAGGVFAGIVAFASSAQAATVAETIGTDTRFSQFRSLLEAAGMLDMLGGSGSYTLFAPTDEAFAELDPATLSRLREPANLQDLLELMDNHIVFTRFTTRDYAGKQTYITSGKLNELKLLGFGATRGVESAVITQEDIEADNGVIHVIEDVLVPPHW